MIIKVLTILFAYAASTSSVFGCGNMQIEDLFPPSNSQTSVSLVVDDKNNPSGSLKKQEIDPPLEEDQQISFDILDFSYEILLTIIKKTRIVDGIAFSRTCQQINDYFKVDPTIWQEYIMKSTWGTVGMRRQHPQEDTSAYVQTIRDSFKSFIRLEFHLLPELLLDCPLMISGDGATIIGTKIELPTDEFEIEDIKRPCMLTRTKAPKWELAMSSTGNARDIDHDYIAYGTNFKASLVVGMKESYSGVSRAILWKRGEEQVSLLKSVLEDPDEEWSYASDIVSTPEGLNIIVGAALRPDPKNADITTFKAAQWILKSTEEGLQEDLQFLESSHTEDVNEASTISLDTKTIIGSSTVRHGDESRKQAFIWTEETGMQYLETLPEYVHSRAKGVSANGNMVIGNSYSYSNKCGVIRNSSYLNNCVMSRAFVWTKKSTEELEKLKNDPNVIICAGGAIKALPLPKDCPQSNAKGISRNGGRIVGNMGNDTRSHAILWDFFEGMVSLEVVFRSFLPKNVTLDTAESISADGMDIVGSCTLQTADGPSQKAFYAHLPYFKALKDQGIDLFKKRVSPPAQGENSSKS